MDPSEIGLTNAEFGLPDDNEEASSGAMDPALQLQAMAQQGALIEQQARSRQIPQRAQSVYQQTYAQPQRPQQPPVNPALADIESRLGRASYYRALIDQPIFQEDDQGYIAEEALVVEDEIRVFILERLGELLGTARPKAAVQPALKPQFNPQQAQALSLFADAMLKKQQAAANPAPQQAPQRAAPVQQPQRLQVQPSEPQEAPPAAYEPPQELRQEAPPPPPYQPPPPPQQPAVRTRSVRQPQVRSNTGPQRVSVAPVMNQQPPAPPPPPVPAPPSVPRPVRRGSVAPPQTPAGRRPIQVAPQEERLAGRRSEASGEALVYTDENGQPPILPLPMPQGSQMTAVTTMKASETAASIARGGGVFSYSK